MSSGLHETTAHASQATLPLAFNLNLHENPHNATAIGPRASSSSICPIIPSPEAPLSQNLLNPSPIQNPSDEMSLSSNSYNECKRPSVEWNLESTTLDALKPNHPDVLNATSRCDTSNNLSNSARRTGLIMHVRTETWAADSHGLFDYETRNVFLNEFKCTCMRDSYHISHCGSDVKLLPSDEARLLYASDSKNKPLLQILWSNGFYYLVPGSGLTKNKDDHLWLVVRHLRDRSAAVAPGDVIKLGRFRLKVKEIVLTSQESKSKRLLWNTDDNENDDCETVAPEPGDSNIEYDGGDFTRIHTQRPELSNIKSEKKYTPINLSPKTVEEYSPSQLDKSLGSKTCRICLCEAEDSTDDSNTPNILVSPCECKGSMKWVHLQCIRTWIAGRLNIRSDGVSFFWRSLACELCKVTYPAVVKVESDLKQFFNKDSESNLVNSQISPHKLANVLEIIKDSHDECKTIDLFEIPKPDVPYTVLEPKSQQHQGYHVVSLANNRVAKLGRGHESDIRLTDISVSRLHSILRFQPASSLKRIAHSIIGSYGYGVLAKDALTNGCFIIEDNRSKFGTLLELRQPLRLDFSCPSISVQVGRTVITISMKRRWKLRIPACWRHDTADIYVVFRQPCKSTSTVDENDREYTETNTNPNCRLLDGESFQNHNQISIGQNINIPDQTRMSDEINLSHI